MTNLTPADLARIRELGEKVIKPTALLRGLNRVPVGDMNYQDRIDCTEAVDILESIADPATGWLACAEALAEAQEVCSVMEWCESKGIQVTLSHPRLGFLGSPHQALAVLRAKMEASNV